MSENSLSIRSLKFIATDTNFDPVIFFDDFDMLLPMLAHFRRNIYKIQTLSQSSPPHWLFRDSGEARRPSASYRKAAFPY
jgi:hypothetical protein